MWIQVRTIDGKNTMRIDNLSKLTKIEDLRERLIPLFNAEPSNQRLFYRGKQMEDGHSLFDYDVGLNDIIQLLIRNKPLTEPINSANAVAQPLISVNHDDTGEESSGSDKENKEPECGAGLVEPSTSQVCLDKEENSLYKIGDIIDAKDPSMGAWFEAKIVEVVRDSKGLVASRATITKLPGKKTESPSLDPKMTSVQEAVKIDSPCKMKARGDDSTVNNSNCDSLCQGEENQDKEFVLKDKNCNDLKNVSEENSILVADTSSSDIDPVSSENCHISRQAGKVEKTAEILEKNSMQRSSSPEKPLFRIDSSDNLKALGILSEMTISDGFIYRVVFDSYEDDIVELSSTSIRPRARHFLRFEDIKVGQIIMANFNYDEPTTRGFWYDCLVTKKVNTRTVKELYATVYIGADMAPLENSRLLFINEVFDIEKPGTQLTERDCTLDPTASPAKRQNKPECDVCLDNPRRKCKECACCVCGGKHEPEKQVLCDECDQAYHLGCMNPPLQAVPEEDEWYCPECKRNDNEIVKAGERLKESKKKAKMASANSISNRDWGKGMACVGRTKQCTIVPSNHFGPIPGIEVGSMWKFRVQVSEAGVHRPHVAGIHGREEDGAFSIVLSGGYEDDADDGDQFYYTGSGGRDLSGNKRTAEQSCDQKLTRMNKALAKNCNAPINDKTGSEARDWRGGKPVRVVRNCKGRKHSKYAPEEGNRYDGIYKVIKYWPEKGKSGFLVWRYLLRRDDPAPAPWTKEGKRRVERFGLTMQYPEGYLESQLEKQKTADISDESDDTSPKKRGHKRKAYESPPEKEDSKKAKVVVFEVEKQIMKLIKKDSVNQKLWDDALCHITEGRPAFIHHLEEVFLCICCQEILYKPITLDCSHNFCKPCITRSFKAEVYSCPACRTDLPKNLNMAINANLMKILNHFFPGYEAGRE